MAGAFGQGGGSSGSSSAPPSGSHLGAPPRGATPSLAPSPQVPRPPPMLRAPPQLPQHRPAAARASYTPPSHSLAHPPRPGPLVRPAPARQGQPAAKHRNFDNSSAGGAVSHVGGGGGGGGERARGREAAGGGGGLSGAQARKKDRWADTYIPAEETIRNDYSGHYVQTGQRPQNHLRNTAVETRFSEYPKLATLLAHKHALTASPRHSIPPTFYNLAASPVPDSPDAPAPAPAPGPSSPMAAALSSLAPSRFDCILLTPPPSVSYDELAALDLSSRASTPSFVWLWVGSGQTDALGGGGGDGIGLERGRDLLATWGYRRCEDIVWLKTNRAQPEKDLVDEPVSLFNPTIEHCLMGIRGTVRRSTDSFLVHCNVDTDVLVWEGDPSDPALKPPELQSLVENFCLGTRRLHLYGSPRALRRGWLTVSAVPGEPTFSSRSEVRPVEGEGSDEEQARRWGAPRDWRREEWEGRWKRPGAGAVGTAEGAVDKVESLLPFVEELDALRPKSPPPRNGLPSSGGLGRGRGAGLGITRSGLIPQSASTPTPPNGLGRGRGRGRRDGLGPGPGPALLPPGAPPPLPNAPVGAPYRDVSSSFALGAAQGMGAHPQAYPPAPFHAAPQHFAPPQQPYYGHPPSNAYAPYQQQPQWQHYAQPPPQHVSPYMSVPGYPSHIPPPPAHPHAYAPPAPPLASPVDALAVQAHLAAIQQQQHALSAHLASLQLATPPPPPPPPGAMSDGAVGGAQHYGHAQGLTYPIGGPRDAWEDARE